MLPRIDKTYKNIRRFQQILGVIIKYGFGDILDRLRIEASIERGKRFLRLSPEEPAQESLTTPMRIRMALEELGPTFIKLGQVLSTRPDLLPGNYVREFQRLQDQVPGFPFETVLAILSEELHCNPTDIFSKIDPEPIAAASMSQVHHATLINGEEVIIKVLRPGIGKIIDADMDILYYLAHQIERHFPEFGIANPSGIVREFEKSIQREMDFTFERNHLTRFHKAFDDDTNIVIPRVYWELSTKRVLTEQFLTGTKVTELDAQSDLLKVDRLFLARKGCEAILRQILDLGLFHGDPHPGNVLIMGSDRIGFLDFGIVGRLDQETREAIVLLLSAIIKRDLDRFVRYLLVVGFPLDTIDRRGFRNDALLFIDTYSGLGKHRLEVGKMLGQFLELLRQYRIQIPSDLVLLIKAIITIEGVGLILYPSFNITEILEPFVKDLVNRQLQPTEVIGRASRYAEETIFFAKRIPRDLGEVLRQIRENKVEIGFLHKGLSPLSSAMERAVNRLALSILAGALILGSSLIIKLKIGIVIKGMNIPGMTGLALAFFIGLWVVIGILRSKGL